jgi:hypothetical protein
MVAYTYLIGSLITLAVWFVLYYFRKDFRKEMLLMGSLVAIFGLIMEALVWTKDWWRPITITGTLVGVEDLIFGFGMGGITAIVYEEIFKKKIVARKLKEKNHKLHLSIFLGVSILVGSILYFGFGYSSFTTWLISVSLAVFIIYFLRPDLIVDSIVTGFIIAIFSVILFALMNLVEPGFVHRWWLFEHLSGIIFLGVPLEDVIWFFTTGLFIGPIYEFWQGMRLKNK